MITFTRDEAAYLRNSHFLHAVKPINNEVKTKSFFSDMYYSTFMIANANVLELFKKLVLLQGRRKRVLQLALGMASL